MNTSSHGFLIPATARVCGIEVKVERNASGLFFGSFVRDNQVHLLKAGVLTGTNKALLGN